MKINPDLASGRSCAYEITTTAEEEILLDRSCESRPYVARVAVQEGRKDCERAVWRRTVVGEQRGFRCGLTATEIDESTLCGEGTTVISCHNDVCLGTGEQGSMPQVKNVAGMAGVMLCSRLREAAELDTTLAGL